MQTAWRSAQSGANLSPPKFPANRENNREFARFWPPKSHSCSLNCTEKPRMRPKSKQGINRGVSGEFDSLIRDLLQGLIPLRRDCRKSKTLSLLRPTRRNLFTQFLKIQVVRLPSFQNRFDDVRR